MDSIANVDNRRWPRTLNSKNILIKIRNEGFAMRFMYCVCSLFMLHAILSRINSSNEQNESFMVHGCISTISSLHSQPFHAFDCSVIVYLQPYPICFVGSYCIEMTNNYELNVIWKRGNSMRPAGCSIKIICFPFAFVVTFH